MDETRITGALPNMTVEIIHGTADDGSAEHLTIHLKATPNLDSALPLFGGLLQLPLMMGQSPFAAWTQATQALMAPWANFAQLNPLAQTNPWRALLSDDFLGKSKK